LEVVQTALTRSSKRVIEHLLLKVENVELAAGTDPLGDRQRVVAGARADFEDALTRMGGQAPAQPISCDERVRRLHPEALSVRAL